jgi:nucleoside phosphorylase
LPLADQGSFTKLDHGGWVAETSRGRYSAKAPSSCALTYTTARGDVSFGGVTSRSSKYRPGRRPGAGGVVEFGPAENVSGPRERDDGETLPNDGHVDVLLLTALTEEYQVVTAVLESLANPIEARAPRYTRLYETQGGERTYRVATASAHRLGAVDMSVFAAMMLESVLPSCAVLVGIAAAIQPKIVRLGDVPFSSNVIKFDDIAVEDGVFTFRTEGFPVDPEMHHAAGELRSHVASYEAWRANCQDVMPVVINALNRLRLGKIKVPEQATEPHLVVAVTGGGPFLLRDAEFRDTLRLPSAVGASVAGPVHPKLVSTEMESHGFMVAAQRASVPACVLKGISDDGDERKRELEEATGGFFRAAACANATVAVLHLLRQSPRWGAERWSSDRGRASAGRAPSEPPFVLSINQTGGQTAAIINNLGRPARRLVGMTVPAAVVERFQSRSVTLTIEAYNPDAEASQLAMDFFDLGRQVGWSIRAKPATTRRPDLFFEVAVETTADDSAASDPLVALVAWLRSIGIDAQLIVASNRDHVRVGPRRPV